MRAKGGLEQDSEISRRHLLRVSGAASIALTIPRAVGAPKAVGSLPDEDVRVRTPSLAKIAERKKIFLASWLPFTAFNLGEEPSSFPKVPAGIAEIYRFECAGFVADAKNDEIMLADGRLDGTRPARIVSFAQATRSPIIWHTLFWNRASPFVARIADRKHGIETLRSWIQSFLTHWDCQVHSIQVVNELHYPWSDHKWGYWTRSADTGPHPWIAAIGDDAPELAFRFAAEVAAPGVKLILNEHTWALTSGNLGAYDRNRKHILATLRRWLDAGVPIHGLGLQLHATPGFTPVGARLLPGKSDYIDSETQLAFLDDVAALGLEIHLTEFDCTDIYLAGKSLSERREACASYAKELLTPLLAHKAVSSFQLWGMTDNPHDSYLADLNWDRPDRRWDGKPIASRPREAMPYDSDLEPKPLHGAIAEALSSAPQRG